MKKNTDLQMEEVKKNAPELLAEMYHNRQKIGEGSIYEITDECKLNRLERKISMTHIVIKKEDARKYLTEAEYRSLEQILNSIIRGREKDGKMPVNRYYICNEDEPYAEMVRGVIVGGEYVKTERSKR